LLLAVDASKKSQPETQPRQELLASDGLRSTPLLGTRKGNIKRYTMLHNITTICTTHSVQTRCSNLWTYSTISFAMVCCHRHETKWLQGTSHLDHAHHRHTAHQPILLKLCSRNMAAARIFKKGSATFGCESSHLYRQRPMR